MREPARGAGREGVARRRALVGATALVLALTGCSGDPADRDAAAPSGPAGASSAAVLEPTPAPPPPPRATEAPVPQDDACHRMTLDEAVAPTAGTGSVRCSKPHTSQTYAVGRVASLVDGHLLAIDSAQVQHQVATDCPAALPRAVGGTLEQVRLSMLRAVWFTPTVEESDAGADWYRCDVVALAGSDRLVEVRGSLAGVLADPAGRETYGMCGTAGPDDPRFERVPCSEPHSWRAFSVIPLPPGDYPGRAALTDAGSQPCQDAAADVAADPLDYAWGFEGPDRDQWRAGQTFIRCWTPD